MDKPGLIFPVSVKYKLFVLNKGLQGTFKVTFNIDLTTQSSTIQCSSLRRVGGGTESTRYLNLNQLFV